ncbi:MAG TPA: bifunctional hydroxymethylpyrimidine kinase/phosphomethylpyrimidine kinase [Actinomycetota bacterium]|nr:bifunctional hydroxymethylpyrimidine kinase/phosphomethylpyrimidine kinase [Actinomycetota bacterium]
MGSPAHPIEGTPVALTIAGSDSGGGAGIQADLKVFFALGCHGTSAVTALTAQNTIGVSGIHAVPGSFVDDQIDAIVADFDIAAAKTGMLGSATMVEVVAAAVRAHHVPHLVVDPVAVSKHGDRLLADDALSAYRTHLFPLARVVTPNLHEAGALLGIDISSLREAEEAARALFDLGPAAVLVKGGHLDDQPDEAIDVLYDGSDVVHLGGPRFDTDDTHGTGCALSAAVAARLAHGDDVEEAVAFAKGFVAGAIERGLRLGKGYGPVNPGWRAEL